MGPLFKYENFEFADVATTDAGKAKLKAAIEAVRSGASSRERLRNLETLTLAGEAGLPIKSHFDWFIGANTETAAGEREVTLFGDPCSDDILEQREKDAELVDFFQNAPIALHWLSGTGHVLWANQTELGEHVPPSRSPNRNQSTDQPSSPHPTIATVGPTPDRNPNPDRILTAEPSPSPNPHT